MIPKLLAVTAVALAIGLAAKTGRPSAAAGPLELKCSWAPNPLRPGEKMLVCVPSVATQYFMTMGDSTGTDSGRALRIVAATYTARPWRLKDLTWASDSTRAGRRELVATVCGQVRLVVDSDTRAVDAVNFPGPEGRHVR
jgi:hypothetical protein